MKKFKELKTEKQLRVCIDKIKYWTNMHKILTQAKKARTKEEKAALKAELDFDLATEPMTEGEDK